MTMKEGDAKEWRAFCESCKALGRVLPSLKDVITTASETAKQKEIADIHDRFLQAAMEVRQGEPSVLQDEELWPRFRGCCKQAMSETMSWSADEQEEMKDTALVILKHLLAFLSLNSTPLPHELVTEASEASDAMFKAGFIETEENQNM